MRPGPALVSSKGLEDGSLGYSMQIKGSFLCLSSLVRVTDVRARERAEQRSRGQAHMSGLDRYALG